MSNRYKPIQINPDNKTNKPILPSLTSIQDKELEKISDPFIAAESLIKMLELERYPLTIDPILQQVLTDMEREKNVENLFWAIVSDCEDAGFPLFNRLNSSHLLEFLHPDHRPLF